MSNDKKANKTREKRTSIKNSIGRLVVIALILILQLVILTVLIARLSAQFALIDSIIRVFALILVLQINHNDYNLSLKYPYMIIILMIPVFGVLIYFLLGVNSSTKYMKKRFEKYSDNNRQNIKQDIAVIDEIKAQNRAAANLFSYVYDFGTYPVYRSDSTKYYKSAELAYDDMLSDLEKATQYIFMEYHAIENSNSFEPILDILRRKASEGVDVRILYDDIGSFVFINYDFITLLQKSNIKCRAFNPMMPFFNLFMNNRDHRKITLIDGVIAYTGGFNIADEYFNITHPYGHWKDTGIRITGNAVNNFVYMFLEMWNSVSKSVKDNDVISYISTDRDTAAIPETGYITPFGDSPIDNEPVGENVYMNILNNADKYCYFITPYLILSDELKRAFQLASKRGVDVRIVVPGIPDKKMTYRITRANYRGLSDCGVKIYEYTPGFCHAKMCVADDIFAVCGTINLDYRSLYHHFENAVLLYNTPTVADIRRDIEEVISLSKEAEVDTRGRFSIIDSLLRLISPLL